MKQVVWDIVYFIVSKIHYLYNYKLFIKFQSYWNYLYSMWIASHLKKGRRVFFVKPVSLFGGEYISIGEKSSFGRFCRLSACDRWEGDTFSPRLTIGSRCNFGEYNHITAINEIQIGDNVLTGRWVTITDNSHGVTCYETMQKPPLKRKLYSKGPVQIGSNVWIGDKATILPGVSLGDGVIVGANTVVTKNVPPYSIVVGNPMRILTNN